MKIFDKTTIENFAQKVDDKVVNNSLSILSLILENSMQLLQTRNPFLGQNFEFNLVNEFYSGAIVPNSLMDIFLILSSPQLELNTVELVQNKFKSFFIKFKYFWSKNQKSKKKKQKYINKIEEFNQQKKKKYNINNFNLDLLDAISKNISTKNIVSLSGGVLYLEGDEFPFTIRIFTVIKKYGSYNFYIPSKNKFYNIDFKERSANLEALLNSYGEKYLELCRIFGSIYYNLYNENPNALFIESLIANLPKDVFKSKNVYERFVMSANYFVNSKIHELFSIIDTTKQIFQEELCGTDLLKISTFFKDLEKYL